MREAAGRLLRTARDERRPSVLECLTYRIRGHSVADAGKAYRTKEEIDEWRHRDPIERFGRAAIAAGLLSEDEIAQIRKEVADEISAAIREAAAAPEPDPTRSPTTSTATRTPTSSSTACASRGPFGEREGTRSWRT